VAKAAACLVAFAALLGGGAAGATAPTLAISATGVLGDDDTIVIAVSNPSTRVDIEAPQRYAFPTPAPQAGHAFLSFADGTGAGRGVVSPLASPPATACAGGGAHDQVWDAGFSSVHVFVFVTGRVMTICPLPAQTTEIVIASKYWSTPRSAGAYIWQATTADGAHATATIRLPVRLTLVQTARGRHARLRARLTANGTPVAGHVVQLIVGLRSVAVARTQADGSAVFTLRVRRKTVVHAVIALGAEAGEPHTLASNRLTVRR